jgi:hypothetical protein
MDIKHKTNRPSKLPKKIIRLDDGMEFVLNPKTKKYRVHLGVKRLDDPNHLHFEYDYERLMDDERNPGRFKVADGTEDIAAMKKAWFDRVSKNRHFDN